jgi:hypothetical protein
LKLAAAAEDERPGEAEDRDQDDGGDGATEDKEDVGSVHDFFSGCGAFTPMRAVMMNMKPPARTKTSALMTKNIETLYAFLTYLSIPPIVPAFAPVDHAPYGAWRRLIGLI